jgi:K+-sensing histidine kinase KdpD
MGTVMGAATMLKELPGALRRLRDEGLPSRSAAAYVFALVCIAVAAVSHLAFAQLTGAITPSILYNPAIFVAALVGGTGGGLLALGFSVVLLSVAFGPRYFASPLPTPTTAVNWILYIAAALAIIWVAGRYRGSRAARTRIDVGAASGAAAARSPSRGVRPNSLAGYIVAIACIAAATLLRAGFAWVGGQMLPLVSYYPAVLIAALIGGSGAGLLAMILSLVAVWWEDPAPLLSFALPSQGESVGLSLYVFATLLTLWLAESHARAVGTSADRGSPALHLATPVLVALAAVLLTTCVLLAIDSHLRPDHLVLGYLVPTTVIAMHYGSTLAVVTSFVSGIAAAYFLFPPKLSFYIADPLHVAELGFFLLLAVIASKAVGVLTDDVGS